MASPTTRTAPPATTFEDATENAADWARLHALQLAAGAAIVVVAVGGAFAYRSMSASKAARAERAFFEAQAPLANQDLAGAERQLRQVAQRYDGTAGGAQAQLMLAQVLYDQGKHQDGLKVLDETDAPDALESSVALLKAAGYEGLGRFADAAKIYEEAADDATAESRKLDLRASAARAYQQANNAEAARRIWADLAKHEEAPIAQEARVRLGELTALTGAR
jgi:TolA-binding protein